MVEMKYDVIIVGAGPGGIFASYELVQKKPELKVAVFEASFPAASPSPIISSVTRSRVNLYCRKIVRAVKTATANMVTSHRNWLSWSAKETRIGKTIDPTPMTPNPAIFVKAAKVPRFWLSRVETGINVAFAVL